MLAVVTEKDIATTQAESFRKIGGTHMCRCISILLSYIWPLTDTLEYDDCMHSDVSEGGRRRIRLTPPYHVCDTYIYMYTHMACETNLNAGHSLVFAGQYTKMQDSPVECGTIGKYDNRAQQVQYMQLLEGWCLGPVLYLSSLKDPMAPLEQCSVSWLSSPMEHLSLPMSTRNT